MPGLLEADSNVEVKFAAAIAAEFLGTFLFAFFGGAAPGAMAAWGNGIALAVLVYVTANVSGGHLNPAVTIATLVTGHSSFSRGLYYIIAQCAGAILASTLHLGLIPYGKDVGCFAPHGIGLSVAFGWEVIMTFLLVVTVYSVAVGEPSFGVVGPLAIGLSLFAAAVTGGSFTGAALNPARVLGPAVVYGCNWKAVPVYILAEIIGGAAAALVSWPLYGTGLQLGRWKEHIQGKLAEARHAVQDQYERLQGQA